MKRLILCTLIISSSVAAQPNLQYHEPSLSFQMAQNNDEWIGTVSGTIQATEEINISAEIDSTGYLELGTGYGIMLGSVYTEAYVSYGRADIIDIYDVGLFAATALTPQLMVFGNTSHEWRKNTLGEHLPVFDHTEREWKNTLGASYSFNPWVNASYTFNYDKNLTDSGYRTNQDIQLTFKPRWVEPYIKYTFGDHRVTPSSGVTGEDSIEFGVNVRF
ncbi:hypothetical protein [Vibrio atypicus]|uniref:hypothetical protein n=1 Tax=Vibrio atypicus TaxID=558271 RepID=UPI00135B9168|nr:hypothetical protein [Vibrio atypicus]